MSSDVNKILAYANVQMAAEALYGLASEQPGETFAGEQKWPRLSEQFYPER